MPNLPNKHFSTPLDSQKGQGQNLSSSQNSPQRQQTSDIDVSTEPYIYRPAQTQSYNSISRFQIVQEQNYVSNQVIREYQVNRSNTIVEIRKTELEEKQNFRIYQSMNKPLNEKKQVPVKTVYVQQKQSQIQIDQNKTPPKSQKSFAPRSPPKSDSEQKRQRHKKAKQLNMRQGSQRHQQLLKQRNRESQAGAQFQINTPRQSQLSPSIQSPYGSKQRRLTYEQLQLTEQKKQPWEIPVPKEQYGQNQNQQQEQNKSLKPYEQYQIDNSQRRITEYISENSIKLRNTQKQSKQKDEYKVVVKQPSPQKPRCQKQCFYKNNDIYGVESQINQRSQNNQNQRNYRTNLFNQQVQQIDISIQPTEFRQIRQIQIDNLPSQKSLGLKQELKSYQKQTSSQHSKQTPVQPQNNQNTFNSNIRNFPTSNKTNSSNYSVNDNKVIQNISQTHSQKNEVPNEEINIDRIAQTQSKKRDVKGINFFYNQEGTSILTQQCYNQPLSRENITAYVSPIQQPQKFEIQDNRLQSEKKLQEKFKQNIPQPLKNTQSSPKTIFYRKQHQLTEILDYLDYKEQTKQNSFIKQKSQTYQQQNKQQKEYEKKGKQQQEIQIDKNVRVNFREQISSRVLKIPEFQPHYASDQQIQNELLDRPRPIMPSDYKPLQPQISQKKNVQTQNRGRRTTKKKILLKGNTADKFATPAREQSENSSNNSVTSQTYRPFGSTYHYEIINDKASKRKTLVQVRRSSRIFSKSKSKHPERLQQIEQIKENQHQNLSNTLALQMTQNKTGTKNRPTKSKPKPTQQSKNTHTQQTQQSKSKIKPYQEEQQLATIQWLKQHADQLHQIVVEHAYMYDDYQAMTQNDQAISRFLQQFQETIQQRKRQNSYAQDEYQTAAFNGNQQIKENQIMRKLPKTTSKQSKSHKKQQKNTPTSKSKGKQSNIKIQRTVQMTVKYKNQNIQQNQQEDQISYEQVQIDRPNKQKQFQDKKKSSQDLTQEQKIKIFNQTKAKYRIPDELPLTVQKIIEPDILNLGIYALIKLGKISEFQLGTKYAITPICVIRFARARHVMMALQESKKLVPPQYSDNIALVALNSMIIDLIENENTQRRRTKLAEGGKSQNNQREQQKKQQ